MDDGRVSMKDVVIVKISKNGNNEGIPTESKAR